VKDPGAVTACSPPRTYSVFLSLPRWGGERLPSEGSGLEYHIGGKSRGGGGRGSGLATSPRGSAQARENQEPEHPNEAARIRPTTKFSSFFHTKRVRIDSGFLSELQTPTTERTHWHTMRQQIWTYSEWLTHVLRLMYSKIRVRLKWVLFS
jgi:hypothetical protein